MSLIRPQRHLTAPNTLTTAPPRHTRLIPITGSITRGQRRPACAGRRVLTLRDGSPISGLIPQERVWFSRTHQTPLACVSAGRPLGGVRDSVNGHVYAAAALSSH